MSSQDSTTAIPWERVQRPALIAALAGAAVCAVGAVGNPHHFFRAYLVGYQFWLGVALGSMVLLMIQYLTGGGWGLLLRRFLEASSRTLPMLVLLALLFIPGLGAIYPWAATGHDSIVPHEESQFRAVYLSVPFFGVRSVSYFAIWLTIAFFLNRWSRAQEEEANPVLAGRLHNLSAAGLVLYGLTITLAAIDWMMSIEPDWISTIYPPLFGVGQVLSGFAFSLVVLLRLAGRYAEPPLNLLRAKHLRDLGSLLLAFVMLWAYMSFSQFLLIWSENLPEEIPWYLRRTRGGWQVIAVLLLTLQFGLPFFLLMSRKIKDNPRSLALVAAVVLVMRFFDLFWWIEPAYGDLMIFSWVIDVGAWVAVGGLWLWWFVRELRARPLLARNDPYLMQYLPEAANHA